MLKERVFLTSERASVGVALVWATTRLESAGADTPRLDAECLLAHLIGCDRLHLYAAIEEGLPSSVLESYRRLVARRQAREPLAYLTGTKEFWSLSLKVTPAVFVPRPETEVLVETVLQRLGELQSPIIADIGCGSGAIAVAVAKTVPSARVYATEISKRALDVAQENAMVNGVGGQITFLQGDLLEPLLTRDLVGRCDLVVSNPPYIATGDLADLPPEVQYEPVEALDGGPDGLACHRGIIGGAPALLRPEGFVVLEMAPEQGASLTRILRDQGSFTEVGIMADLSGRERLIIARTAEPGSRRSRRWGEKGA
ncbi:MAG: peptide chain release factor N(5)-glutamine methyltransferase [Candidatus Methylomirabilales bacterium]